MRKKKHIIGFNIFVIVLAVIFTALVVPFNMCIQKATVAVVEGSYGEQFAKENKLKIVELADSEKGLFDYHYETDDIPFQYNVNGETLEIIEYEGKDDIIIIPSYVMDASVTAIAMDAYNMRSVIVIPETVTEITGEFSKISFSGTFLVEFAFTVLAFVLSLVLINVLLPRYNKGKDEYLLTGNQMVSIAFYAIVQTVFGVVTTCFFRIPMFSALLISLIILIIFVAIFMLGGIGRTHVKEMDAKIVEKTATMKTLKNSTKNLADEVKNPELRKNVQRLVDEVRFSDAVSRADLVELEQQIENTIKELKEYIANGNEEAIESATKRAMNMVEERNTRCKSGK